jgi:hypothetical protein
MTSGRTFAPISRAGAVGRGANEPKRPFAQTSIGKNRGPLGRETAFVAGWCQL